jgi:sulfur carrier protein ThiS adenylyltransferase
METIKLIVNEQPYETEGGKRLDALRDEVKPGADVLILDGAPCPPDRRLMGGEHIVLIQRGEIPSETDLEALMVARHTPGVHEAMRRGIVGIAGLGGLGSNAAVALARMGVGSLILADFDVVEPSNLNRQQYFIEHIGAYKTDALMDILTKINPYIRVETHRVMLTAENIPVIFRKAKVILECFDGADQKVMLIETVAERLPDAYIVSVSGLAGYGENNSIQTRQLGDRVYVVGDLVSEAKPGRGLMAPRVSIAAGQQANLAVSLLMDPGKVHL